MPSPPLLSSVKRLHSLELYDDLLLLVELNLQEHRLPSLLSEEEQALVFSCVGDAHFECSHYSQSTRYYEKALRAVAGNRRSPTTTSNGDIRFRMHKALLGEGKVEEALKCLEVIPKGEMTPKMAFALAKLTLLSQKPVRGAGGNAISPKVISNFKWVLDEVPEALLCRTYLTSMGVVDDAPDYDQMTDECRAWLVAKQYEAQKDFSAAAATLESSTPSNNLRLAVELAKYCHLAGDRHKALHHYQRAHSLDSSNTHGMDALAFLLANEEMTKELEQLAGKLVTHNGQLTCGEVYVAYGYLARLQHKPKEALQFGHRAVALSGQGKQRSYALLLKGQLLLDGKRVKDSDAHMQEALLSDNTNIEVYELYTKSLVGQKRFSEAHRLIKSAFTALREDNPRLHYLHAYILSEDHRTDSSSSASSGINEAVRILEEVATHAPQISEAIFLLAKLYDRLHLHEKAIGMLERHLHCSSSTNSSQLHRLLGDFLAKMNKAEEACSAYRQALSGRCPDSKALKSMEELNVMPGLATPECPATAAFSSSSSTGAASRAPPMAPTKARRGHHSHHMRE